MDTLATEVLAGTISNLFLRGLEFISRITNGAPPQGSSLYHIPVTGIDGDIELILSNKHIDQIRSVTESQEAIYYSQAYAISKLTLTGSEVEEAAGAIADAFAEYALGFDSDLPRESWILVWETLCLNYDEYFKFNQIREIISPLTASRLQSKISPSEITPNSSNHLPVWLRDLLELVGDNKLVAIAQELVLDVQSAARKAAENLKFDHVLDDVERPISDLYIDRTLRSPDGATLNSTELDLMSRVRHIVVTGDPGAGKTTLTQHLIAEMAEQGMPIRVIARDVDHSSELLLSELVTALHRNLQLEHVNEQNVKAILTLGRAVLIIDGIDEITDEGARRKFVQKIEGFANRYPLISVLVTARNTGYERAPLSANMFERYKIEAFSDAQVEEYAEKWFNSRKSTELLIPFMRDINPLPDIRRNPLMLSLICTLYKSRRQIPRNRREVYNQCADLLFMRWDSLRSIDQPVDHIHHGHDLIQDIALFYYKSSNAQQGVERNQLIHIVAQYLSDSAGVMPAEARHRASNFVEFCSNRAWLLGRSGTSPGGADLFVFTHRTFMEFYAAERMARENTDPQELADVMRHEYTRNPASVMPELVLASAEHVRRDASREILRALRDREVLPNGRGLGRYLPLSLRAVCVLPIRPSLQNEILEQALELIAAERTNQDDVRESIFIEMLELGRDPRARLEAHLFDRNSISLSPHPDQKKWQTAFLRLWCVLSMRGEVKFYESDWGGLVEKLWSELEFDQILNSSEYRAYAIEVRKDHTIPIDLLDLELWKQSQLGAGFPSAALHTIRRFLAGSTLGSIDDKLLRLIITNASKFAAPQEEALEISRFISESIWNQRELEHFPTPIGVISILMTLEMLGVDHVDENATEVLLGFSPRRAVETREFNITKQNGYVADPEIEEPYSTSEMRELAKSLPNWFKHWAKGKLSFIKNEIQK